MRITNIELNEDTELPTSVTVKMPIAEAAMIAKLVGKMNHMEADNIINNGGSLVSDIYDSLVGSMFNRFWEDGLSGYMREAR